MTEHGRDRDLDEGVAAERERGLVAELEADNRRLRRLLDRRDAPGELRHRLRSTLALLRTIIRRSAVTERDRDGYIGQLEDRMEAITRAQAAADAHGEIDLHGLVTDELFHYGLTEGERLRVAGPRICLAPRSGQIFALAMHELVVNAVEHGAAGASRGRIDIDWTVAPEEGRPLLVFRWAEEGSHPLRDDRHRGFGTEVLTRLLSYELQAETWIGHEPPGLLCSIRIPFTAKVGRLEAG